MAATRSVVSTAANGESDQPEELWQANYVARQNYFANTVGPLPSDIFGFTNPDMPTTVQMAGFDLKSDGNRAIQAGGTLSKRQPAPRRAGFAGYGYELIVVTQSNQQWPLNFLQWAVNAEIGNDVGLLRRIEKYDGLTVEQIQVDKEQMVNVWIAKAQAPLPTRTSLPAGGMEILVATTITAEESSHHKVTEEPRC